MPIAKSEDKLPRPKPPAKCDRMWCGLHNPSLRTNDNCLPPCTTTSQFGHARNRTWSLEHGSGQQVWPPKGLQAMQNPEPHLMCYSRKRSSREPWIQDGKQG